MVVKYRILIYASIGIGIFILLTTIRNYREKVIIDSIIEKGNKEIGVVEYVDTVRKDEILIQVADKSISKDIIESENYHEVGDTVVLYSYAKYDEKYVFEYDDIDSLAIIAGLVMTILFLSPIILLLKNK